MNKKEDDIFIKFYKESCCVYCMRKNFNKYYDFNKYYNYLVALENLDEYLNNPDLSYNSYVLSLNEFKKYAKKFHYINKTIYTMCRTYKELTKYYGKNYKNKISYYYKNYYGMNKYFDEEYKYFFEKSYETKNYYKKNIIFHILNKK